MVDSTENPRTKKRNIVAEMRSRPRKPAESIPEPKPISPLKRFVGELLHRSNTNTDVDIKPVEANEKNRMLAERLEALEDRSWEIRESEELHRSLAEAFGDIIIDRNETGSITFANQFADQYFDEEYPIPDSELATETEPHPISRDIRIDTLLGERWFSWTDIEVRDDITGGRHVRSVGRDITQRKYNEVRLSEALKAAKAASETKSRFLAMVSHEMRTPLNGITGMARLLSDTPLNAAQNNHVEAIRRSGSALLGLVTDLLDSAQIDAGEMKLRPERSNLRELVEQSAEMLAPRAAANGLTISTFIDPALPDELMLDADRLKQVLLNLGGNAVKFIETGGVAFEVTGSVDDNQATVTINVSDSGPGLGADEQRKVFAEFAQLDTGATRQHDGAGLGLFIAQQIAKLMGSTIEISSFPGHGSRFGLTFQAEIIGPTFPVAKPLNQNIALVAQPNPARSALLRCVRAQTIKAFAFDSVSTLMAATDNPELTFDAILLDCTSTNAASINQLRDRLSDTTRLIVVDHAGSGREGQNSEFDGWLTWPVRQSSLQKILTATGHEISPIFNTDDNEPQINRGRVLLVEDNEINMLVARRFLEKLGFKVTQASDGKQAITAFENAFRDAESFDHVLLDLNMPGMDGHTTMARLRELETGASRTNILVLTADDRSETCEAIMKNGGDGFIAKPLDFDILSKMLTTKPTG